jgi:hypothetical protein
VPDDSDARLVVMGVDHPYSKEPGNAATVAAKAILEMRGNTPRLYRNTLVFLAADKIRLQDLDEAARKYLAWESILFEKEKLDLSPLQVKQAESQKTTIDTVVSARLPETYQWLLVPVQTTPQSPLEWQAMRLSGQEALAVRASKKLKGDELLITGFAATRLRMELDRVPLWRGNHVGVRQLLDDFAAYLYLPRLTNEDVLIDAIRDGLARLTWRTETFGYAEAWDEQKQEYKGLQIGQNVRVLTDGRSLLVRAEVASAQMEAAKEKPVDGGTAPPKGETPGAAGGSVGGVPGEPGQVVAPPLMRRFHGSVKLDPIRIGRDAGRIGEEVVQHLSGLLGASVEVSLEIHAEIPDGAPEKTVRDVTENCRTLKFESYGFEED